MSLSTTCGLLIPQAELRDRNSAVSFSNVGSTIHCNETETFRANDYTFDTVVSGRTDMTIAYKKNVAPLVEQAIGGKSVALAFCSAPVFSVSEFIPFSVHKEQGYLSSVASQILTEIDHANSPPKLEDGVHKPHNHELKDASVSFSWYTIDCDKGEAITDVLRSASSATHLGLGQQPSPQPQGNSNFILRELGKGRGMMVPGLWEVDITKPTDAEDVVKHVLKLLPSSNANGAHTVFQMKITTSSARQASKRVNDSKSVIHHDPPGVGRITFILFSGLSSHDDSTMIFAARAHHPLKAYYYPWVDWVDKTVEWVQSGRASPPYHKCRLMLLLRDIVCGRMSANISLVIKPTPVFKRPQAVLDVPGSNPPRTASAVELDDSNLSTIHKWIHVISSIAAIRDGSQLNSNSHVIHQHHQQQHQRHSSANNEMLYTKPSGGGGSKAGSPSKHIGSESTLKRSNSSPSFSNLESPRPSSHQQQKSAALALNLSSAPGVSVRPRQPQSFASLVSGHASTPLVKIDNKKPWETQKSGVSVATENVTVSHRNRSSSSLTSIETTSAANSTSNKNSNLTKTEFMDVDGLSSPPSSSSCSPRSFAEEENESDHLEHQDFLNKSETYTSISSPRRRLSDINKQSVTDALKGSLTNAGSHTNLTSLTPLTSEAATTKMKRAYSAGDDVDAPVDIVPSYVRQSQYNEKLKSGKKSEDIFSNPDRTSKSNVVTPRGSRYPKADDVMYTPAGDICPQPSAQLSPAPPPPPIAQSSSKMIDKAAAAAARRATITANLITSYAPAAAAVTAIATKVRNGPTKKPATVGSYRQRSFSAPKRRPPPPIAAAGTPKHPTPDTPVASGTMSTINVSSAHPTSPARRRLENVAALDKETFDVLSQALRDSREEVIQCKNQLARVEENVENGNAAYMSLVQSLKENGSLLKQQDKENYKKSLKDLKDYSIYKDVMETAMVKMQTELDELVLENKTVKAESKKNVTMMKQRLSVSQKVDQHHRDPKVLKKAMPASSIMEDKIRRLQLEGTKSVKTKEAALASLVNTKGMLELVQDMLSAGLSNLDLLPADDGDAEDKPNFVTLFLQRVTEMEASMAQATKQHQDLKDKSIKELLKHKESQASAADKILNHKDQNEKLRIIIAKAKAELEAKEQSEKAL